MGNCRGKSNAIEYTGRFVLAYRLLALNLDQHRTRARTIQTDCR